MGLDSSGLVLESGKALCFTGSQPWTCENWHLKRHDKLAAPNIGYNQQEAPVGLAFKPALWACAGLGAQERGLLAWCTSFWKPLYSTWLLLFVFWSPVNLDVRGESLYKHPGVIALAHLYLIVSKSQLQENGVREGRTVCIALCECLHHNDENSVTNFIC